VREDGGFLAVRLLPVFKKLQTFFLLWCDLCRGMCRIINTSIYIAMKDTITNILAAAIIIAVSVLAA
jgi:hypothetical protein